MIVARYYEVLNLKKSPFSLTPDVSMFYLMRSHVEAVDTVVFAYDNGVPMVRIYGEPGMGKTMLLRYVQLRMEEERGISPVYVSYHPVMGVRGLLRSLLGDVPDDLDADTISRLLKGRLEAGDCVLLIDEAQDLGTEGFLMVKHLLDMGNDGGSAGRLFVVCAGTMKLRRLFETEELEPLSQRAPYHYILRGLTKEELSGYIDYRLRKAGYSGDFPFSRWALRLVWKRTRGNPRKVNILAERALLAALSKGKRRVGRGEVKEAIRDLPPDV